MKNILWRVMLFLVGVPLLLALVFFFPHHNHLILNIVVITFCLLGALEFSVILRKKNMELYLPEVIIFGFLPPAAMTLYASFGFTAFVPAAAVLFCAGCCLLTCAFTPASKLNDAGMRLAAGLSILFYPGVFLSCMIPMAKSAYSTTLILTFLCIVMANDSAAWLFGMLFGRNNKGVVAASPNKSVAGFVAGFCASIAVGVLAAFWEPEAFTAEHFSAVTSGVILGFTTGIAATIGDLAESALKRSAGIKDSGSLIPGRGGILDSIDSICLAAPVFYIVYRALFMLR